MPLYDVYHGSTEIIQKPKIGFSKKYLDFGEGFYVTTFKEQAENGQNENHSV